MTADPAVSQWAEIMTTPFGLPTASPSARQASAYGPPRAFIGEPWPKKTAG